MFICYGELHCPKMSEDIYAGSSRRKRVYTRGVFSESAYGNWNQLWNVCRCIRGMVFMKARIYAGSVKGKRIWKLGFAKVCGMRCLICFSDYCYMLVMYSYRSGLFEWWLCCWWYWWKIMLMVDWLMIQWMNWWGYKFQFDECWA